MASFASSAQGHCGLIYLKGLGDGATAGVDLLGGKKRCGAKNIGTISR